MICDVMTDESDSRRGGFHHILKLSKIYKLINKNEKECNNVSYENEVEELKNITIDFDNAGKLHFYFFY